MDQFLTWKLAVDLQERPSIRQVLADFCYSVHRGEIQQCYPIYFGLKLRLPKDFYNHLAKK